MTSVTTTPTPTGALSPEQIANMNPEVVETITSGQPETEKKYAGKFATVEELERGYAEAQKALSKGAKPDDKATEEQPNPEEQPAPKDETQGNPDEATYGKAVADVLVTAGLTGEALSAEYATNGTLSEESFKALEAAGFGRETVTAYMNGLASGEALVEAQVKAIMDSVGGDKEYSDMISWASKTLPKEELASFNKTVDASDPHAAQWAVDALYTKYVNANGKEANPVNGNKPKTDTDVYRSKEEMQRDMRSAAYKTDPAFRTAVAAKLQRSEIFQTKG